LSVLNMVVFSFGTRLYHLIMGEICAELI